MSAVMLAFCCSERLTCIDPCGLAVDTCGLASCGWQLPADLLDDICIAYAAGEVEPRTRNHARPEYTHVQWREFALDCNRIQAQPFLERLAGGRPGDGGDWSTGVMVYPQLGEIAAAYPEMELEANASPIRPVYGTNPTACTASFGAMPSTVANNAAAGQRTGAGKKASFGAGTKPTKAAAAPPQQAAASGRASGRAELKSTRSTARSATASARPQASAGRAA